MNKAFNDIYKGRKVLLTGHTGFKGSWLSVWLTELGAEVIGFSLEPPSEPNNFAACALENKIIHIHGDVRNFEHLLNVFENYQPEFVFHLAAQPLVRLSYEDPKTTFDTNIGGTVNLLEAIRLTPNVRVLVNITSDKCYDNREWVWGYRENDPMGGHDPYSASKGCAELVFAAYLKSFFSKESSKARMIGVASARAGNVIGGGDWGKDRLIPDCVRALMKNQPVGIRSAEAIRPWQHVLEPLSGYLWLGTLLQKSPEIYNGPWNFGPNDSDHKRVEEVVEGFIKFWGSGRWENLSKNLNASHEASTLRLCCDKARTYLRWQGTLGTDECLRMTAEWYKLFYSTVRRDNMYQVCSDQIWQYTEKAKRRRLPWSF